jgi:hypothetical protein
MISPVISKSIGQVQTEGETAEISVKGSWMRVPAHRVGRDLVIVRGKFLKVASVLNENWLATEVTEPDTFLEALKKRTCRLRADIFTFAQLPPVAEPMHKYYFERESIAAVRTTSFEEWWNRLPHESRKNVRKAQKRGVSVVVQTLDDSLIRSLVELNNETPIRQNIPFPHYGKSADQVRKDQSTYLDRSDFIWAFLGDELIGFMKLVYRGDSASILQFISKTSHYDKKAGNAVLTKAVQLCSEKGISYLTYGMMDYGNKRQSSLRDFKIRNGFEEMLIPRYYAPVTAKGRLCLRMKLHRGLLGVLPPRVITVGVSARAQWYNLKEHLAGVAQRIERSRL